MFTTNIDLWCFSFVTLFNLQGTRPSASAAEHVLSYHVVQLLSSTFSTFSKFFRRLSQLFAVPSDSSFILPELPGFVKHFFRFIRSFFALDAGPTAAFQTACLLYQPFPFLSSTFICQFPLKYFLYFYATDYSASWLRYSL